MPSCSLVCRVDQTDSCHLLQLPDPCLLAVMQCCADDPRSLFSAARAHSRLHQAAVLPLRSMTATVNHETVASAVSYLTSHGQHIEDLDMMSKGNRCHQWYSVVLFELPNNMSKLTSLQLAGMSLQLLHGRFFQGVLAAGPPLKQLQLHRCKLCDHRDALAAALLVLPTLQRLSIRAHEAYQPFNLSSDVAQVLRQLTFLELSGRFATAGLQHLPGLTSLQDLRLWTDATITASMLSDLQLTHLELYGAHRVCVLTPGSKFEPDALAGKAQLRHVVLRSCRIPDGSAGVQLLLSHLQLLQQLTYLDLSQTLAHTAPAAAYAVLTASSKLRHLDVSRSQLPVGVWQHMFPSGRQLPYLRQLDIGSIHHPNGAAAVAPEGSRLVSCCPELHSLHMQALLYSSQRLAGLPGLSSLQQLSLRPCNRSAEGLEVVCQLTGLRELIVTDPTTAEGLLLQLTQLRQLMRLLFSGTLNGVGWIKHYKVEVCMLHSLACPISVTRAIVSSCYTMAPVLCVTMLCQVICDRPLPWLS